MYKNRLGRSFFCAISRQMGLSGNKQPLFLFSGIMLVRHYPDQKQSAETFDQVAALIEQSEPETTESTMGEPDPAEEAKNEKRRFAVHSQPACN